MLLHQGFGHLLSNGLVLLAFGWQLEAKYGTWRVALLAVLAALGGGLLRRARDVWVRRAVGVACSAREASGR